MNEVIDEEKKKQFPLYGFLDYFVNNFTNEHYEYGTDSIGICRYPLDKEGKRIIEALKEDPFTYGLYGGTAAMSETIAHVGKGDTPSSLFFELSSKYDDIYSERFGDLSSPMIDLFMQHTNQHLTLLNQKNISDDYQFIVCKDFSIKFNFKYDQLTKKISRTLAVQFMKSNKSSNEIIPVYYVTDNVLTTQTTLKNMDIEFFKRYYKEKIKEAYPDLSFEQIYEFLDLSKWNEHLKTLVKMAYY